MAIRISRILLALSVCYLGLGSARVLAISANEINSERRGPCRANGPYFTVCTNIGNPGHEERFRINPGTLDIEGQHALDLDSNQFSSWDSLVGGRPPEKPIAMAAAMNADGRLEVFALGENGRVYHAYQPSAGVGPWEGWRRFLGDECGSYYATDIAATSTYNADGTIRSVEVFMAMKSSTTQALSWGGQFRRGKIFHAWQANGKWTRWEPLHRKETNGLADKFSRVTDGHIEYLGLDGRYFQMNRVNGAPEADPMYPGEMVGEGGWHERLLNATDVPDTLNVLKTCPTQTSYDGFFSTAEMPQDLPALSGVVPCVRDGAHIAIYNRLNKVKAVATGGWQGNTILDQEDRNLLNSFLNRTELPIQVQYDLCMRPVGGNVTSLNSYLDATAPAISAYNEGVGGADLDRFMAALSTNEGGNRRGASFLEMIAAKIISENEVLTDEKKAELRNLMINKMTPCLEYHNQVGGIIERDWRNRHMLLADVALENPAAFLAYHHLRGDVWSDLIYGQLIEGLDNFTTGVFRKTDNGTALGLGRRFVLGGKGAAQFGLGLTDLMMVGAAVKGSGKLALKGARAFQAKMNPLVLKPVITEAEIQAVKAVEAQAVEKIASDVNSASTVGDAKSAVTTTAPQVRLAAAADQLGKIWHTKNLEEIYRALKLTDPGTVLQGVYLEGVGGRSVKVWRVKPQLMEAASTAETPQGRLADLAARLTGPDGRIDIILGGPKEYEKLLGYSIGAFETPLDEGGKLVGRLFLRSEQILPDLIASNASGRRLLLDGVSIHELGHMKTFLKYGEKAIVGPGRMLSVMEEWAEASFSVGYYKLIYGDEALQTLNEMVIHLDDLGNLALPRLAATNPGFHIPLAQHLIADIRQNTTMIMGVGGDLSGAYKKALERAQAVANLDELGTITRYESLILRGGGLQKAELASLEFVIEPGTQKKITMFLGYADYTSDKEHVLKIVRGQLQGLVDSSNYLRVQLASSPEFAEFVVKMRKVDDYYKAAMDAGATEIKAEVLAEQQAIFADFAQFVRARNAQYKKILAVGP